MYVYIYAYIVGAGVYVRMYNNYAYVYTRLFPFICFSLGFAHCVDMQSRDDNNTLIMLALRRFERLIV